MNMKRLLTLVAFFATLQASAQQVNPVPDYVFRNQMSVGRNAVTDTAAYFSIGPRYGATKGFMPPIVGDTSAVTGTKRNGLLIFSVQRNNFMYWDSVIGRWAVITGSTDSTVFATRAWRQKGDDSLAARINLKLNISDTATMLTPYLRKADTTAMLSPYYRSATATAALATKLNISDTATMLSPYARTATVNASLATKLNISDTSSMLTPYIRHAGYGLTKSGQSFLVDTLNIATRAWRQKGIDSVASLISGGTIGGSGTTNYVPKFTAASTIGNSLIYDNGSTIGIGSTAGTYYVEAKRNGTADIVANSSADNNSAVLSVYNSGGTSGNFAQLRAYGNTTASTLFGSSTNKMISLFSNGDALMTLGTISGTPLVLGTTNTERLRIFANGRVGINTTTDAGYQLDVNGTLRSVNGANFATTSGGVTIGSTTAPITALDIYGNTSTAFTGFRAQQLIYSTEAFNTTPNASIGFVNKFTSGGGYGTLGSISVGKENTTDGNASGYMSLYTYGPSSLTEKLRITSGGNVGIGTTSPGQKVEIYDGALLINRPSLPNDATNLMFRTQAGSDATLGALYFVMNARPSATGPNRYVEMFAGDDIGFRNINFPYGNVGIGTTNPGAKLDVTASVNAISATLTNGGILLREFGSDPANNTIELHVRPKAGKSGYLTFTENAVADKWAIGVQNGNTALRFLSGGAAGTERMRIFANGRVAINTTTDAGYQLDVNGNTRVTGKIDVTSNTTFGLGVARSGTSEVAGQIYNSNGILYFGAESSAGGQIFSGSSAYAGVIGTGANYPLQFATNNTTRATITNDGNLLVGTTTNLEGYKLQVNGYVSATQIDITQAFFSSGAGANLYLNGTTNGSPIQLIGQSLTGANASAMIYGGTTWNTTGNPSLIDLSITNTASGADANFIKIVNGASTFRVTKAAEVVTSAPTGGSIRKWKLGEAATVSPTLPNRTIRVEIDGTVYYLHAKTTND